MVWFQPTLDREVVFYDSPRHKSSFSPSGGSCWGSSCGRL